jgi:hypothetical protein
VKNTLILFLLLGIGFQGSISRALAGGSDAGNGGGLAEKNLLFAYGNLQSFIDLCLETSLCRTDATENDLLKKIKDSLDQERKAPLDFRSDKATPDFFKIDGLIRVAKTGDNVGDPIFINQDLLYSTSPSGNEVAVDVPLATSILIHELGHHHGVKDHSALDRLGFKLQTLLLMHEERSEFWNGNAQLVVYQLNSVRSDADKKKISLIDQLVLENRSELYNLTGLLSEHMKCPISGSPAAFSPGLRLYNVYGERGIRFDSKTGLLTKPMKGWFIQNCEKGKEWDHGDFTLLLTFKKVGKEMFEFLPEKTRVTVTGCKERVEVCK